MVSATSIRSEPPGETEFKIFEKKKMTAASLPELREIAGVYMTKQESLN